MLGKEIEKEIRQENKVIFDLNIRQVGCVLAGLVCSVILVVVFRLDFWVSIYPDAMIGVGCFMFGWRKWDGLYLEQFILRWMKSYFLQNSRRIYRAKNRYVELLNREYERRRLIDRKCRKMSKRTREDRACQKMSKSAGAGNKVRKRKGRGRCRAIY